MRAEDAFALADLHLGERYNRGHVKALCDEVYGAGIRRGAQMARLEAAARACEAMAANLAFTDNDDYVRAAQCYACARAIREMK